MFKFQCFMSCQIVKTKFHLVSFYLPDSAITISKKSSIVWTFCPTLFYNIKFPYKNRSISRIWIHRCNSNLEEMNLREIITAYRCYIGCHIYKFSILWYYRCFHEKNIHLLKNGQEIELKYQFFQAPSHRKPSGLPLYSQH